MNTSLPIPGITVTHWDLALAFVVTVQSLCVAYTASPRLKALFLTLPFPFTTISLSLGIPVNGMHVASLVLLFGYTQAVRLLYGRAGVPILPAIALSVLGYIVAGGLAAAVYPSTAPGFWVACAGVFAVGLFLRRVIPPRSEPAYRTRLPLAAKLPIVLGIVLILILVKNALAGFAALFPLVGTVGAYETRHSLWTLGRQVGVLMLTLTPMLVVTYLVQPHWGLHAGLAAGWGVFLLALSMLQFLDRPQPAIRNV